MKVVFSRKGFDSSSGGGPSPLIGGGPVSIPIPTQHRSETTYGELGLGGIVECMSKGSYTKNSLCHYDPMFSYDRCAFGQTGAAQGHLTNQDVGVGDVFLFFGLFANLDRTDPHHRIFGYLKVERVVCLGSKPKLSDQPDGFKHRHPHTIDDWNDNNTLYLGTGRTAKATNPQLRLTAVGESVSTWKVPSWLRRTRLTYHSKANRWKEQNILQSASRGQEFVTDISGDTDANRWLMNVLETI
ncbi:MAG: hypothetical protein OXG08_06500 [Gammaproteobacteria bacterium]|nr:hypothetical protein [Gammaproteobacteria bacterium]